MTAPTGRDPLPPPVVLDRTALFLDFDGTLVEIAARPEAVTVPADLPELLERLSVALGGALAVVSGRPMDDIDRMLAPARLAAAGAHGAELRPSAQAEMHRAGGPVPIELRKKLLNLAAEWQERWPGIRLEDKTVALALHFRQAPEAGAALGAALSTLDLGPSWRIIPGHCVYELKSATLSKASAVRSLMQAPAFAGRRPLFIGDDRTDLDGMAAAVELGGSAIAVGDLKTDLAQRRLPDPNAVRGWLRELLAG